MEEGEAGMRDLEQVVIAAVADQLLLDIAQVQQGSALQRDLGADSVDLVEMVLVLEERLGVVIADEVLPELVTVADVIRCLEGVLAESGHPASRGAGPGS
jgi:acyl carrier protein